MAGRHGPALFELIRSGGNPTPPPLPPAPAAAPAPRVVPKPVARPAPVEEAPAAERPGDRAWAAWSNKGSWLDLRRSITIPMSAVLFVLAGAVVVVVVTYVSGFQIGKGRAETQARKDLGLTNSEIHEPDSIPVNSSLVGGGTKAPEARPLPPTPQPDRKPKATELAAPITPGTDPRVVGMNYYLLASGLERDGAQKIADFLGENGLPAAAVVDRKASGSNNGGSYVVFVAKGIKPEEYKARSAGRLEVENEAARLGKAWKDRKGKTDFTGAYWQRYSN